MQLDSRWWLSVSLSAVMFKHDVSEVEVLVVGAGPAGVMCALALSKSGVHVRIVDRLPELLVPGRADGIQLRTLEILQSYGIAEQVIAASHRTYLIESYIPDSDGNLVRSEEENALITGGRYNFNAQLSQGAVERVFRDTIQSFGTKPAGHGESAYEYKSPWQSKSVKVEQGTTPISMDLDSIDSSGSVAVRLQARDGTIENVRAKYVIGCDGAHSWVRSQLGFSMAGDQSNAVWGVIDAIVDTDFPDVRKITWINTKDRKCMLIPRENGLIRLYVQLFEAELTGDRFDRSQVMLDQIEEIAIHAFKPYRLSFPQTPEWWTVYVVGQRLTSSYSAKGRIFLAGDACHTHSPHAGQGMNAAIADSHNLAWRLVHVLRGWAKPSLLETYDRERQKFAKDLIDFDRNLAAIVRSKSATSHGEHQRYMKTFIGFISGIGIQYDAPDSKVLVFQDLAKGAIIGRRLPPLVVLRMVDCRPFNIHDLLPADTRYKLLVFCQNRQESKNKLEELVVALNGLGTDPGKQLHDRFDVVYIEKLKKQSANMLNVPSSLVRHWSQAFIDDVALDTKDGGGTAFESYKISIDGCVILVRPDGYVGTILPLGGDEFVKHLDFYTENVCKFTSF